MASLLTLGFKDGNGVFLVPLIMLNVVHRELHVLRSQNQHHNILKAPFYLTYSKSKLNIVLIILRYASNLISDLSILKNAESKIINVSHPKMQTTSPLFEEYTKAEIIFFFNQKITARPF